MHVNPEGNAVIAREMVNRLSADSLLSKMEGRSR
jgi:hypothetical protein